MRLELATYVVSDTHCSANPNHYSCAEARSPEVETAVNHSFSEAPDEIMVFLTVKNTTGISDEDPYEFELEIFGTFLVEYEKKEGREQLMERYASLVVNCAQMLYSGARDYLHTITGKGPYGTLKLPSAYLNGIGIEFKLMERSD
jgi:preprotein translocase subunit SecB